ncbi:MAG TPA: hypothetical protein VM432_04835 [Bdellovibrionales bacterium]|nr:hypothetical protein [Bdellovibrionales bacterium]
MKVRSHKSGLVRLAPLVAGLTAFSMFAACVKARDEGAGIKTHATPGQLQRAEAKAKSAFPQFDSKNPQNQAFAAELKTATLFQARDKDDKNKVTVNLDIALKDDSIKAHNAINGKESTELTKSDDTAAAYKVEAKCTSDNCVMVAVLVTEVVEEALTRTGEAVDEAAAKAPEQTAEEKAAAELKEAAKKTLETYKQLLEAKSATDEQTAAALEAAKVLEFETVEAALEGLAKAKEEPQAEAPKKDEQKKDEPKEEKSTKTRQMLLLFAGSQKTKAKSSKDDTAVGVEMKLVYPNDLKAEAKAEKKEDREAEKKVTQKESEEDETKKTK